MLHTILICLNCKTTISIQVDVKFHLNDLDLEKFCCEKSDIDFIFINNHKKLRSDLNEWT